ncbi:MAG: gamma-glutamyltransferase family protein, partial [Candidatus Hermodarchaeota archaeon]|nr:gamma-glutamyltransferase family protein [Candidatus Hermodarchaeota archaeon]
NASGRSPAELNLQELEKVGITEELPRFSVHTVTVPGAAAGWEDTVNHFGTMPLSEVLAPAIELAEKGYPVAPLTAASWKRGVDQLKQGPHAEEMLRKGDAPNAGEIMKLPTLARTFRDLAEQGKSGFYKGRVAEAIVELLQSMGGKMSLEDLKHHTNTFDNPISTKYKGVDVFEIPPNGQGITALIALNILEEYDFTSMGHSSVQHMHLMIEAMRLAFADTRWYVADPAIVDVPIKKLISKKYAAQRRTLINPSKATLDFTKGSPMTASDTVYFTVVDGEGNACSFIGSNYMGFGTGLIPKGCGFTLQNRGAGFSLNPDHPNVLAPKKRPYHTIIPGMALKEKELYASFGVMGGFNQPQGHVQVLINLIDFGMNPQEALNAPRFTIRDGTSSGQVALEDSIPEETMKTLGKMGHDILSISGASRMMFGRGQIITRNPDTGVLCGGTSPRADGIAIGW